MLNNLNERILAFMNTPKISVIIPIYNAEKYIEECLQSVLTQTLKDIEIICVDDGSTDHSLQILQDYQKRDKRILLYQQENLGAGRARNNALKRAQGEFISFMDADDWYPYENTLESLYFAAIKNKVLIAGGSIASVNSEGKWSQNYNEQLKGNCFLKDGIWDYKDYQYDYGYQRFIYNREMLEKCEIRFPDHRRYQDPPFFINAMLQAKKFYAMSAVTYLYRSQPGHVKWTREKVSGLIQGLKEELYLSRINGLSTLHKLCISRCEIDFLDVLSDLSIMDGNIIEELEQLNQEVDRTLSNLPEDFTLKPLQLLPARRYVSRTISSPKISVLMPSLNVSKYICECILSVINQSLEDIEIICVDAGSTDGTADIIASFAKRDKRIKIVHSAQKSYGYQMNLGLEMARGEYIGIVETDDWIEEDMYEKLWNAAEETGSDMVKCNYFHYTTRPEVESKPFENLIDCEYYQVFSPMEKRTIFTTTPAIWSGIYKKDTLIKNGISFNETKGASYQDTSFHFMVCTVAESCYLIKDFLLHYRKDNENSSVNSSGKVFCITDEMHYYEQFLDNHSVYKNEIYKFYLALKYEKYRWNYERLKSKFQWMFLEVFYKEFKNSYENGLLDAQVFGKKDWDNLMQLILNPILYYKDTCKIYSNRPQWSDVFPAQILKKSLKMNPKVSVIIPAYNLEQYIEETLNSVLQQSEGNIEIICINDGSEDRTKEILLSCAQIDNRITLIDQMNKGQSTARNAAINIAKGEFIIFLDGDDLLEKDAVEKLYCRAVKDDLDILYYDGKSFYEEQELEKTNPYYKSAYEYPIQLPPILSGKELFIKMHQDKKYRVSPCLAFYRREYLITNQIYFFDGIIHEDNIFTFKTMLLCEHVGHTTEQFLLRRVRSNSTMTSKKTFMNVYGFLISFMEMLYFARTIADDNELNYAIAQELDSIAALTRSNYNLLADKNLCRRKLTAIELMILDRVALQQVRVVNRGVHLGTDNVYSSYSYKIGRMITFIPRKIRGGIRCCKEHGISYTICLFWKKVFKMKRSFK